jgi:hypothetical protein
LLADANARNRDRQVSLPREKENIDIKKEEN